LLLVAEAPPCAADRYFYFDDVPTQDSLFRHVWKGLTTEDAGCREQKPAQLAQLRDAGVFLIDLCEEAVSKPTPARLRREAPGVVSRASALEPERVILIKASVFDAAFQPMKAAGLPVVDERIPFPGSGQQRKFLDAFRRAVSTSGFTWS
jgi:hypothetical protein